MKKFWIRKAIMITFFVIAAVAVFSLVVMSLWNAIIPAIFGLKTISFFQAMGLLVLGKILFGGFRGGWRGRPNNEWRHRMKDKWEGMTPEQQAKFKAEWKNRCGGRWGRWQQPESTGNASNAE